MFNLKSTLTIALIFAACFAKAQKSADPDYFTKFDHIKMTRTTEGVLTIRFTTNNGPIIFTGTDHHEFVNAFSLIAQDRGNKVVIMTGTGNEFFTQIDGPSLGNTTNPREWDRIWWEGQQVLQNLSSIGVPVIAAINGPASLHTEYALTADIIIANKDAYFQDLKHLQFGIVPGDGVQTVWTRALGDYRGKYFLYMQEKISANEGKQLGFVSEVLDDNEQLMKRANEIAARMLTIPELTRRHMRAMLTLELRKALLEQVGYGLSAEGISSTDLKIAKDEKEKSGKQ
jgi:enoyl-CoA hydratase/carnithine racemase